MYGFFQILNVILGVIRSKLTALLLGAEGVGIIGLMQSIIDLARSTAGLGLDASAIKEIAAINESNTEEKQKTLYTVNILYFGTAALGALGCILFSGILSKWAFGSEEYQIPIILLALAVVFVTLTAWVVASLQGLRKVKYMAYASTAGSLLSFIVLVPAYYFFRLNGIVPMFIGTNIIIFLSCYYFYKRLRLTSINIPWKEFMARSHNILRLGGYLVLGGIVFSGSLFIVKSYINHSENLEAAGLYQAVWGITSLFWSMVLRVASADYFPKLCNIIDDKKESSAYINHQISFLMAVILPVIVGMSIFADKILLLLYDSEFESVASTLNLHLLGVFYKIIITPLALVLLAKNKGQLFLITEFSFWAVYLILFFILYPHFEILATGISFFAAYLFYIPIIVATVYKIDKLKLHRIIYQKLVFITLSFIILTTIYFYQFSNTRLIQCLIFIPICAYSIYEINNYFDLSKIISRFFKTKK